MNLKLFSANRSSKFRVNPIKQNIHPNAYLQRIKNLATGLKARNAILTVLEQRGAAATAISKDVSFSYSSVIHHLHLLEAEGTVARKGSKPYYWFLTGRGQKRLIN